MKLSDTLTIAILKSSFWKLLEILTFDFFKFEIKIELLRLKLLKCEFSSS